MRRFFIAVIFLLSLPAVRAEVPALLQAAFDRLAADVDHWAYTQTAVSRDGKGKVKDETVVRYDPSQPFDVQWTPLKIDGKEPTARQVKKYRHERDKNRDKRRTLGELLNLEKAVAAEETPTAVTYEVPLIKDDEQRFPPEKFRELIRVRREQPVLEHIAVKLRDSLRAALIVKVISGEAALEFSPVDPKFAPPITAIHGGGTGSVFFVKVGATFDVTRTDFKRVKPYNDRFQVKIGPMKTIDF